MYACSCDFPISLWLVPAHICQVLSINMQRSMNCTIRMASHAPGKLKVVATDQPDIQISEVEALALCIIHHLQVQIAGMLLLGDAGPRSNGCLLPGQGAASESSTTDEQKGSQPRRG